MVKQKKIDEIDDRTLILAEESRKAQDQMKNTVRQIIGDKYPEEKTEEKNEEKSRKWISALSDRISFIVFETFLRTQRSLWQRQ